MLTLLDPIQVGDLAPPSRVIMAPLTRLRGTTDNIPTPLMVEYYTQRASAGLIITEGTPIAPMAVGYAQVPGIWSEQQIEAWKPVTASVHAHGGRIFQQIWHVGRWTGVEGMFLDVAAGSAPGRYRLTMQYDLDHRQTTEATIEGDTLVFTRDGHRLTLRPTEGAATGLKYLAAKNRCLTEQAGEMGRARSPTWIGSRRVGMMAAFLLNLAVRPELDV